MNSEISFHIPRTSSWDTSYGLSFAGLPGGSETRGGVIMELLACLVPVRSRLRCRSLKPAVGPRTHSSIRAGIGEDAKVSRSGVKASGYADVILLKRVGPGYDWFHRRLYWHAASGESGFKRRSRSCSSPGSQLRLQHAGAQVSCPTHRPSCNVVMKMPVTGFGMIRRLEWCFMQTG